MDVSFINPFVSSTMTTYKNMLSVDIVPGAPFLKNKQPPTYDISGVIGLSGIAQGIIALGYSQDCAIKTITRFVGGTATQPEIVDGIGELVNIVAGYAKKDLSKYELSISLPNVIIGKDHRVTTPTGVIALVVPFDGPLGRFNMEVALITPKTA